MTDHQISFYVSLHASAATYAAVTAHQSSQPELKLEVSLQLHWPFGLTVLLPSPQPFDLASSGMTAIRQQPHLCVC